MSPLRVPVVTANAVPALDSVLDAVRTSVMQGVQHPVSVGIPEGTAPGIWIWPWRIGADDTVRNVPRAPVPGGAGRPGVARLVDFLVLVEPATGADWLSLLDGALVALHDAPVLTVAGETVSITLTHLDASELGALFAAAGVRLLPAVSASLRYMATAGGGGATP